MVESGSFENGMSHVEMGDGDINVLIIPGYDDAGLNTAAHPLMVKYLLEGFDAENLEIRFVGRIPGVPEGYTTRDIAEDYAEVIRPETHVIGHSLGGMIVQHLAVISDDVKTMTLCNSGPDDTEYAEENLSESLEKARSGDWRGFYDGMMSDVEGRVRKTAFRLAANLEKFFNDDYADDIINSGQAAADHESWELLEDIDIPVLLITGENDKAYPPEILEKAHGKLSNSDLQIVESDHEYMYDETGGFYERWRNFVQENS